MPISDSDTFSPSRFLAILLIPFVMMLGGVTPAAAQTTFTVNLDIDAGGDPADGTCDVSSINPGNQCTLREAIIEANAAANGSSPDVIAFDIPSTATPTNPHVINVSSALPLISEPVEIDGSTEPDYSTLPVIEIDGSNAGTGADGFDVDFDPNGGGSSLALTAVAIVNFDGDGLFLADGVNRIVDAHIGVRADGLTAGPNGRGAFIGGTASGSSITNSIVSANLDQAVSITTSNVRVANSRIGVDKDGGDLGNSIVPPGAAISVNGVGARITGNIIRYNEGPGVRVNAITPPNNENLITGNAIGNNSSLGIDLEGGTEDADDRTGNDAGDGDDGPNNLQNYPTIVAADVDASDNVTLTYYVDSDPTLTSSGASAYPIEVDIYRADTDGEEGFGIISEDTYSATDYNGCGSPPCPKQITVASLVPVSQSDFMTATATDANNNTSEFSAPAQQLPVELAAFTARPDGDRVVLQWSTLSETGNDGFAIERSVDGSPFARAGYRSGAGTTTQPTRYRLVDARVPAGATTVEYRLRQIDVDGDETVLSSVTVRPGSDGTLRLGRPAPHPVETAADITVRVPEGADDARLVLFDLLGRPVRTLAADDLRGRSTVRLSADGLATGVYLLRLTGNGQVRTEKVTILR